MNDETNKKPKSGSELISAFFKQLNQNKEQYPCPEVIDEIVNLHNKGKLSLTNISNILDKMSNKKNAKK